MGHVLEAACVPGEAPHSPDLTRRSVSLWGPGLSTAFGPCHCSPAQLELKVSASAGSGYISDIKLDSRRLSPTCALKIKC